MITKPTFTDLSRGQLNRYELTMVTAKTARTVTDEYVKQRDEIDLRKQAAINREGEKVSYDAYMDPRYRDERAVRVAVDKMFNNEISYELNEDAAESAAKADTAEEKADTTAAEG